MYCIECGAQIPDNSKFCQYCGKSQLRDKKPIEEKIKEAIVHREIPNEIIKPRDSSEGFVVVRKMIGWYLGWSTLHLGILLIFSDGIFTRGSYTDAFWPFGSSYNNDIGEYDIREFLVYTLLPLAILIILDFIKADEKQKAKNSNENGQ